MANQTILMDGNMVGSVGGYPAHPPVYCPDCGSRLYRLFNASTEYKFVCLNENKLVSLEAEKPHVAVTLG